MPDPDFRALCAELLSELEDRFTIFEPADDPLIQRARAALAQPVSEPPTDKELENTYNRAVSNYLCSIKAKRNLVDDDLADSRPAGLRAVYNWGQGNA
jgi:hypothetical protein